MGSPFGNAPFHLQDMDSKRVCEVYLEQDECVVAIWEDCTVLAANTQRSWQGRIDLTPNMPARVWLQSTSRGSAQPPAICQGRLELEAETPRALLDCERSDTGQYRMYFERVLEPREALAAERGSFGTGGGPIVALHVFRSSSGTRMVAALSDLSHAQGGGLHLYREVAAGDFRRAGVSADYGFSNRAQASSDGRWLVVGGATDLFVVDTETDQITGHQGLPGGGEDEVAGIAVTGPNEVLVAMRRESSARAEWQRYSINPLAPSGPLVVAEGTQLVAAALGAGPDAPLYALVARAEGGQVLELDPTTLAERASFELPSREPRGFAITASPTEFVFADHRGFATFDLVAGRAKPYYPVPYFQRISSIAYEPTRDWLVAAGVPDRGNPGFVYAVDRKSERPIPRGLEVPQNPLAVEVHEDSLFVAEGNRVREYPLPIPR